jgi:hypothetical protein
LFNAIRRCVIRATVVHPTGIGACTVTATQSGNEDFHPARPLSRTFSITRRSKHGQK